MNTECLTDMAEVANGISSQKVWALKMIDSWGFIPSGIFTGETFDLGNFDECLSIARVTEANRKIRGKYCFLIAKSIKIATCFPVSCFADDMTPLLNNIIQNKLNTNISIKISETSCQTNDREPWNVLTVFTIVILSVLSIIATLATLYDYFFCEDQSGIPIIVKSFSARANSRVLFRIVDNKSNPNVIECLHGIRCMSLIWVIFSHEFIFATTSPNLNMADLLKWAQKPLASFVLDGYFSVDSFFVLGGLLVSMIVLRTMEKSKGKLNPFMMYLHRIIRILPVVAMAILIYMTMMPVVSGGPMFKGGYHGTHFCARNWYWTLLFVQNYAVLNICLDHTWYLAVDMQLYIISPILLIAIYKWGKKAAAGICVLIVLLSGCLFATQMVNNYSLLIRNDDDDGVANKKLYLATHNHAAPWLIGFLFGYFLHLNRGKKFELSKLTVWSGWILSLAMLFTSIFALYPAGKFDSPPISVLAESCYYTLTRLAWPLAICWIIFACTQGYGGLANSFLSSPLWQPFSRLSYSMYVWHMLVQEVNSRNVRTTTYFSAYQMMLRFWRDFGNTLLMSYVLYLIIEAPLSGFDSLLRRRRESPPPSNLKLIADQSEETENQKPEIENLAVTQNRMNS
ncbi:uncharacterized protein Dana_GF18755, isoform B [Drosophila ananassae]|uniref:Uncharacterized protein, isoform B n=2 Tax=Drosophila ananassae TaxID=7217 RepID=A0A0P8Y042_DROAN|nr:uncharacterized protein Dana_GF18755, isoform B [Drosophila ananassae]